MKKLALILIAMLFLEGCSSMSDNVVSEAIGVREAAKQALLK